MVRVLILVEGETEENFVNNVLASHLYSYSKRFQSVTAKLMGNARQRNRRGGIVSWASARNEIINHLTRDTSLYMSTMVDYYALPENPNKLDRTWPGRYLANDLPFAEKSRSIETKLKEKISIQMGNAWNPKQFIPYVMMHEFEAILFSDCEMLAYSLGKEDLAHDFQTIRDNFSCPEEINDSPDTHPSRRITNLFPRYQKPLNGIDAAEAIGLATIRQECPGFRRWLEQLESLAQ